MRNLISILALVVVPAAAHADYLYSTARTSGPEPYVLFVADNSGSMDEKDGECCDESKCCDTSSCCDDNLCGGKGQPKCTTFCGGRKMCSNVCGKKQACSTYCGAKPLCSTQPSRIHSLKETLTALVPQLDGVGLGLSKYGNVNGGSCTVKRTNPLPTSSGGKLATSAELLKSIQDMVANGGTPIGGALSDALSHLKAVRQADSGRFCRNYVVVLLTDGEPNCPASAGGNEPNGDGTRSYEAVNALRAEGIPTYVIGFGKDVSSNTILTKMARLGGTARSGSLWCKRGADGSCTDGNALFAKDSEELTEVLKATFEQIRAGSFSPMPPIIATVPQVRSEVDRVARNFLAYSAFEQPGFKGHLYGVQLFLEKAGEPGTWAFTDFNQLDVDACGTTGNPCLFDAGQVLQDRTKARRILSAIPEKSVSSGGALTLRMGAPVAIATSVDGGGAAIRKVMEAVVGADGPLEDGFAALSLTDRDKLAPLAADAGTASRAAVVDWLHGLSREWKLGDLYHSAPAIVAAPPYNYRARGYPAFKASLRQRPPMIYVGANDGMIHAFHASADVFAEDPDEPRWVPGEEAWSFLPFNMAAKASLAALNVPQESRFFSQDLSCRVDDVLVADYMTDGELECPEKDSVYCGWRTVLLCGQGWGGSWYVALDITDPLSPKPMWETTHRAIEGESHGLGRTWGVPTIALFNLARGTNPATPTWVALFGSGYNSDAMDADGKQSSAYRLLNMPFLGGQPDHGNGTQGEKPHVFGVDVVTGEYLDVFHMHGLDAIVADIPVVDTDYDSFSNVAYVGGWAKGTMSRISFGAEDGVTTTSQWKNACSELFHFGDGQPITSRPSAFADPDDPRNVFLFVGTGVDKGAGIPDLQGSEGTGFAFRAWQIRDDGGEACPTAPGGAALSTIAESGNVCVDGTEDGEGKKGFTFGNLFADGQRLLSAPTLAVQKDRTRYLTFTSWKPEPTSCGDGTSYLYCADVTATTRCVPCGNLDGDADGVRVSLGSSRPSSPSMADGQIYSIDADGVVRVGNADGTGAGPGGGSPAPNAGAPRAVVFSWREVF